MIKLDDFLSKKKEPAQVLDLSRVKITSKDDFKRHFDKIPECKVKPEKISSEQVKIKEKDFTFAPGKKEEKAVKEWNYPDPTPPDMKGAKLEDLCPINIDWKMLTTIRPKSKVEEDMFSRLVQLGKLDLKYQQILQKSKSTDWVRRTKNPKSSVIEMRVISCKECGEDFCDGSVCSKLTYENFFRPQPTTTSLTQNLSLLVAEAEAKASKKKKTRKKRRQKKKKKKTEEGGKVKVRRRKLGKMSIFNRPASTGCTRDHSRKKTVEVMTKHTLKALNSTRSYSYEQKRVTFLPKRSKSAPRIHFDCDTSDSELKRQEYISDSGPSNTDYSSQSDSESPDRQFFSSHLSLSGRRKLLSARVSFADRKQRRDSAQSCRSKFIRQCTLYKDYFNDDGKYGTTSESSSPARSRSVSKSPGKGLSRGLLSAKVPSTVEIQFDEEFSRSGLWTLPNRTSLPVTIPPNIIKQKNVVLKRQNDLDKLAENMSKVDVDSSQESGKDEKPSTSRKQKTKVRYRSRKLNSFSPESCLKAKGLFGTKVD